MKLTSFLTVRPPKVCMSVVFMPRSVWCAESEMGDYRVGWLWLHTNQPVPASWQFANLAVVQPSKRVQVSTRPLVEHR